MDIREECKGAELIGISGHIRPDGDCVGSTMALWQFLCKACPTARVEVLIEEPSEVFAEIKGVSSIMTDYPDDKMYDVFFVLDSSADRTGNAQKYVRTAGRTINIDHHISNSGSCDCNYIIPTASSTSELVYDLIKTSDPEGLFMDIEIAKAVYTGIIHDTGVLQYSNTSPKTLQNVAELISYGFDFSRLIDETFYEKTYAQSQILGRALLESIRFMHGKCVASVIDRKTMDFYGVNSKDFEGIVNQLRVIKGVECAIFMYETDTLHYKVSLRSCGNVDVAAVAECFGGGGHVRAAGCNMNGTFHDVVNNLSERIALQIG